MPTTYQCEKGHVFLFPEVVTEHVATVIHTFKDQAHKELDGVIPTLDWFETVTHRCPVEHCGCINLKEYIAPQENIISVKSVDLSEVDSYLKEGYLVESLYAKNAVLVKKQVTQP